MNNAQQVTGLKDTIRAEMDVALELGRQRQANWWVHRELVKVESHIEMIHAPNTFYWTCNDKADKLASIARDCFSLDELKKQHFPVLQGTRAICVIDGRQVNNDLLPALKEKLMGSALKMFLMEKYGWNEVMFQSVCWEAHQTELHKIPIIRRPTLIKYIHGWLATKQRRYREGAFKDPLCPLCGSEERTNHFLRCMNSQLLTVRNAQWKVFKVELAKKTATGCWQVFQAGLDTLQDIEPPSSETRAEWPPELQVAYSAQEAIGWEQVLLGRLAKHWEELALPHEGGMTGKRVTHGLNRSFDCHGTLAQWCGKLETP